MGPQDRLTHLYTQRSHTMLATALTLTYFMPLGLYPSRRLALALTAPLAVVLACFVALSPLALSCLVLAVGVAVMSGSSTAPVDPGYLARAAIDPDAVIVPRPTVRFLPPVWADTIDVVPVVDALQAEADRLLDCYDRALRSRHKARAEKYWARYRATLAQTMQSNIAQH